MKVYIDSIISPSNSIRKIVHGYKVRNKRKEKEKEGKGKGNSLSL